MSDQVILSTGYTFDASAKTITLTGDYSTIQLPQIKSIKNVTKGLMTIYDCTNPDTSITLADSVISWTPVFAYKGTAFADTDELQIIVSTTENTSGEMTIVNEVSSPVPVNITNVALPIDSTVPIDINVTNLTSIPVAVDPLSPIIIDDSTPVDVAITNTSIAIDDATPVDVTITNSTAIAVSEALIPDSPILIYNGQTIAANSNESSVCQATSLYKKCWFFITHTASTNLTVEIRACSSDLGADPVTLQPFTLNTSVLSAGCCITDLPPYVRIYVLNSDVTNATDLTVKMFPTR